jgi:hypothetical protein
MISAVNTIWIDKNRTLFVIVVSAAFLDPFFFASMTDGLTAKSAAATNAKIQYRAIILSNYDFN